MKKIFSILPDKVTFRFGNGEIKANVADSFAGKTAGLSFRERMEENEGLFFDLGYPCRPFFWNFGMRFPIDVIWIRDGKIIGIEKNIPAMNKRLKIFYPREKADSALEILSGTAERLGVALRDTIDIIHEE